MAGILLLGLVCNLFVRQVDAKHNLNESKPSAAT
jgi:hypothetical protein